MGAITEICDVLVEELTPYENNAKIHGAEQVEKIANSISEFGFLTPCLIDRDKNIIAGHGRVMAAKKLGLEKVPCVYIEGLTDEQRRAYILADNRLGELGEWDFGKVQEELEALDEAGFDIDLTGFELEGVEVEDEDEERYTTAINIPQYEPTLGADLEQCVDTKRYDELLEEIEASGVSEDEKQFLRLAAARHIVFSYKHIADYYAGAEPEMQYLMERSALVIIDVGDAIKYGYAKLSSYLDEIEEKGRQDNA